MSRTALNGIICCVFAVCIAWISASDDAAFRLASSHAEQGTSATELLVSLDADGRLLPLKSDETPFDAVLQSGGDPDAVISQPWHYNIYAQFYFPGEDPQIDFTFLANREYPRMLINLDRKAALIWINTASSRAEAEKQREELARQGLEGAFVARARGDWGYSHSKAQLDGLAALARQLDEDQCKDHDPFEWLRRRDLQRRYALRVRLLYIDGISGINTALDLRKQVQAELGECGLLNQAGGGYRLFCGAFETEGDILAAYKQLHAATGITPRMVCINANGEGVRWIEEDYPR